MASITVDTNKVEKLNSLDDERVEGISTEDVVQESIVALENSKVATVATAVSVPIVDNEDTTNASITAKNEKKPESCDEEKKDERSWDYSNRKVIVHNVLKFVRNKEVDKMTKTWLGALSDPESIRIEKYRKPPKENWVVLVLEHENMVQPLVDHINNGSFTNRRGMPIHALRADSKLDDLGDNKRKHEEKGEERDTKKPKVSRPKTIDEVRDAITPLWRLPYQQQLVVKRRDMVKKCAIKIVQEVKAKFRSLEQEARRTKNREAVPLYEWAKGKRSIDIRDVLASPRTTEYRNKVELNFGYRLEPTACEENGPKTSPDDTDEWNEETMKKIPSVGFMASGWSGGVYRPHSLANIPSEACAIADIVEEFLSSSPIPPYDSHAHRGLWRVLTIRISERTGECMLVIRHAPPAGGVGAKDDTDDYSAVFEKEKARLVSMLTDRELSTPKRDIETANSATNETKASAKANETPPTIHVTSVFFQEYGGLSNPTPEHPVQHVFGKRAIQERLGTCTFQVSPGAFFQVNTEGAEILYNAVIEQVREVSSNPEKTVLFDVCCGTGTIGLACLKEAVVGRVVGVDISEPAIEDAKTNAELNGFGANDNEGERVRFVAAKAEQVLLHEIRKVKDSASIVAVVDPAREGLHPDVIRFLRSSEKIKRLVYVSCSPTSSLVRDAGLLCAPPTKKYAGLAFRPTYAQPVDMFPQTPHCEMVMTFDRLDEASFISQD